VADSADQVLAQRLDVQRLTSEPAHDPLDIVRLLTCVQAQDAPLARYSLGLRSVASEAEVRAALDSGRFVRTHILRPTWHFVAADDLRWILALTSSRVQSAMAARHRQLELSPAVVIRAADVLMSALARRQFMTRPELAVRFADAGLPSSGEQVGHLLMLAELHAVVCSGPMRGTTHTYGLVDELPAVLASWQETHERGTACVIATSDPLGAADRTRVRWLTPELSKGLEFDLVVVVNPASFGPGIRGAVDRYVAMTRATQQLVVLDQRPSES
jgi:hypothetical protein